LGYRCFYAFLSSIPVEERGDEALVLEGEETSSILSFRSEIFDAKFAEGTATTQNQSIISQHLCSVLSAKEIHI
jgi:hypothetical protein